MNTLHIAGRLGADPEVRFTSSGQKVTVLRVAAKVRRGKKDETIWWRVTIWGDSFDNMISYLKKGSAVIVIGEMNKPEIFNDREGKPQISMSMTAMDVQFSPFGSGKSQSQTGDTENAAHTPEVATVASGLATEEVSLNNSDEMPF